eukprot:104661-Prymnesium_polylepis.2
MVNETRWVSLRHVEDAASLREFGEVGRDLQLVVGAREHEVDSRQARVGVRVAEPHVRPDQVLVHLGEDSGAQLLVVHHSQAQEIDGSRDGGGSTASWQPPVELWHANRLDIRRGAIVVVVATLVHIAPGVARLVRQQMRETRMVGIDAVHRRAGRILADEA